MLNQHTQPKPVVAFCGTRGLPARYGGFETAVDELTARLLVHGYDCDVFCRRSSGELPREMDYGRCLVYVKGSRHRILDTFVSALQTGWYLWRHRKRYLHVFWFNNANLPGIIMTRLAGIPMSVNTDGLEWQRPKWSWPFKAYFYLGSYLVSRICRSLISDSHAIRAVYRRKFGAESHFIPYGCPRTKPVSADTAQRVLSRFGLQPGRYFLQITRFEPDNLPLAAAQAFAEEKLSERGFKMVIVGYQSPTPYARSLKALDGTDGISIVNATYNKVVLSALRSKCFCYVHGNSVGGTNPALLEAMAACPRVLAIDCVFSREVLGDTGLYFDPTQIGCAMKAALRSDVRSEEMYARVTAHYDWDRVARSYLRLAQGLPADYQPAYQITIGEEIEECVV